MLTAADFTIQNPGNNWFWGAGDPVMSVGDLWSSMSLKAGQGSAAIVNVPPNSTGVIPANIVSVLSQFNSVLMQTYNTPVAQLQSPVTGMCPGLSFTVAVDAGATFDQVMTMEDLTNGQVVQAYSVEARSAADGTWQNLNVMHGGPVGLRVIDWGLGHVTGVDALRFNCTASITPQTPATITSFAAYLGAPIPSS